MPKLTNDVFVSTAHATGHPIQLKVTKGMLNKAAKLHVSKYKDANDLIEHLAYGHDHGRAFEERAKNTGMRLSELNKIHKRHDHVAPLLKGY